MRDNCIDVRPCTPAEILFGNGPPRFPNRLASNLLFRNRVSHPRFNKTPAQSHGFSRNGSFPASFSFFLISCTRNFFFFFFFPFKLWIFSTDLKWNDGKKWRIALGTLSLGRRVKFYSQERMENWARMKWKLCKGVNFCQIFRSWPLTRKLIRSASGG